MIAHLKQFLKDLLQYEPLENSTEVRGAIDVISKNGLPYCPPEEGDLLYSLIRENRYSRCLETGFHTGSTALYMLSAVADRGGDVVSICVDDDETVERGLQLVHDSGLGPRHQLIRNNSNIALPELFSAGHKFGLIFMDGWKTFDHLAFEMYLFNQMLETGGVVAFDDAYMPSVRKAIRLLKSHYGYEEVQYNSHNQTMRLRLRQILMTKSFHRPYRALLKVVETSNQLPFVDWHFYRRV